MLYPSLSVVMSVRLSLSCLDGPSNVMVSAVDPVVHLLAEQGANRGTPDRSRRTVKELAAEVRARGAVGNWAKDGAIALKGF